MDIADQTKAMGVGSGAARPPRDTGRRLNGAIAHHVGVAILSGDLKPGDILSSELSLADSMNVSRTVVREAIRVLSAKGLVESRPKAGTRVLPRERWNLLDPDVLGWAFAGEPSREFVADLFELRILIEPAAARLAAVRRGPADLEAIDRALADMRRHTLANELGRTADRDFHAAILRATHNTVLFTLSAGIAAAVAWTTQFKQRKRALPRDPIPDHVSVRDAIASGNAEAADQAMRMLVELALKDTDAGHCQTDTAGGAGG